MRSVEHAAHWLPSQGPISIFVHHNTLHAFEELNFDRAVVEGGRLYHCEPYLSEHRFRQELAVGRIGVDDLQAVLLHDLGDDAGQLVASFGTRYALRLAMLQFPLQTAPPAELQWLIAETDARRRFRPEVAPERRAQMITSVRAWVARHFAGGSGQAPTELEREVAALLAERGGGPKLAHGSDADWEAFTLRFLWLVCERGVLQVRQAHAGERAGAGEGDLPRPYPRLRDVLVELSGRDADRLVDEVLIRFTAAFLDQGFSGWPLPHREEGFWAAFVQLYACGATAVAPWMRDLQSELRQLRSSGTTPTESIAQSLSQLGLDAAADRDDYILHSLLALRGWAGLIWQMETAAPWTPRPAPAGSLLGYLAVRLVLERLALQWLAGQQWSQSPAAAWPRLLALWQQRRGQPLAACQSPEQEAFSVFQLAQVRGWSPPELVHLSLPQWRQLLKEIRGFGSIQRRCMFQRAYERRYRQQALDALLLHGRYSPLAEPAQSLPSDPQPDTEEAHRDRRSQLPLFQIVCCIDDREESFRRHLEEVEPACETFAAAGFYAVAMYYRGAAEAHYRPLCPIVITPQHYVREEPVFTATSVGQARSRRRRWLGHMSHQWHARSRTLWGGVVTGVLGSLATFPLVARILAPRLTAQLRSTFGSLVRPPATELIIERIAAAPGPERDGLGYSVAEMAAIVTRILQDIGLVRNFSQLIVFTGHGSSSLNNPHESAYNCGACSGGRGGPNARSFALMANDPRVRRQVAASGIEIPEDVRFVGAYHNTCNDVVEYFDLDQLPRSHRELFRRVERTIDLARARNAHERSRRFESAPLDMSPAQALEHAEERAEDLSQARPEYNHATNALCFVGRRQWSRGLFLDRRAFLTSYDPSIDDDQASILSRILSAAIPVCAGISLEYLFSTVDTEGYGCGSKLPHNIASLAGVMTGAASDIRPGLSAQMVEIHEPMRILFVIETTAAKMLHIMQQQPAIDRLVRNAWVQLAIYDPAANRLQTFEEGRFVDYRQQTAELPQVASSLDWYRGCRGNLGFASIRPAAINAAASDPTASRPVPGGVTPNWDSRAIARQQQLAENRQ